MGNEPLAIRVRAVCQHDGAANQAAGHWQAQEVAWPAIIHVQVGLGACTLGLHFLLAKALLV